MKQSLKENFVLITGIALPVLLGLVFFAATKISTMGVEPPKTKVLYATNIGERFNNVWDVIVRDGKPVVTYTPIKDGGYWASPTVYLFDPAAHEVKTFKTPKIEAGDKDKAASFPITGFGQVKISEQETSPDGYVFVQRQNNSSSLMADIFAGGRNHGFVLKNRGRAESVPQTENDYNVGFVGWVVE